MNKIKDFYSKHQTAIIATSVGITAVAVTCAVFVLKYKIEHFEVTPDDFASIELYNDFVAAMKLAKEYDAELAIKIK